MKILYDPQIFLLQVFGGISLYHCKLMEEFCNDSEINFELPLTYSENKYLKEINCLSYKDFEQDTWIRKKMAKFFKAQSINVAVKKLRSQKFDVFHPTYYAEYALENAGKKPLVITVHDMTQEIMPEYFIFDKKTKDISELKIKLIQKAAKVIAISENTKNDIIKICNLNENKIELIHHGASFDLPEVLPEYLDIPKKYILFVGSRAKYKNFYIFVNAISPILRNNKSIKLVLAGGSSINNFESNLFKKLNIMQNIKYISNCDNNKLTKLYKNALCFVYPSLYEGFGFPILEAFKCGCPIAISNISCFREIAGDAAAYIDPYDEISIKNVVEKLISDNDLRKTLVEKGYQQVKKYSWKETAKKTKEVYKKAL